MLTGVLTPAASRIALALSASGAPYFSSNESFWPPKPGGTIEYDGAVVPSYAFVVMASRSMSWAAAWRTALSLATSFLSCQTQ